ATFTASSGATVSVNGTTQISGQTQNNFTNSVQYVVTASDGTTQTYMVTVSQAPNNAAVISAFSIGSATGIIIGNTINVTVPYGTTVTNMVATFTASPGAMVSVNGTTQISGQTQNNFTNSVQYLVTAQNGTTTQNYTVTVTVQSAPQYTLIIDGSQGNC